MERLVGYLLRALRPRVGWQRALLGLGACLCVTITTASSTLRLPASDTFFWAALLGFLLGLRGAPDPERPAGRLRRALRLLVWTLLAGAGAALLVLRIMGALPPLGLLLQDTTALGQWAAEALERWRHPSPPDTPALAVPVRRSALFLAEALPRVRRDLAAAPDGGQAGAGLLVATVGSTLTWAGALLFGRALLAGRNLLAWQLPLLATLVLTTIFGGGGAFGLVLGIGLLLLSIVSSEAARRERAWSRAKADYSDELRLDALAWGGGLALSALMLALALPAWVNNPLALALWGQIQPPSGLAVLEQQARPPLRAPTPAARIGISRLPSLELGVSLEQGDPQQVALRIQVSAPLPETGAPHYWRARLFERYNGRGWQAEARVLPETPFRLPETPPPGLILQDITDLRADRTLLVALPDLIGIDQSADTERLEDGTVAALTSPRSLDRYRVLSRPQEQATRSDLSEGPPPDMSLYTRLPGLPARVSELARAVTAQAASPAERALALERYLRGLPYTYTIPPLPPQGDAVDFFLFETRTGYCSYYASAMAVMARSLGIPARVATGYFTGAYDQATRTYTVYENEAHAWPELYLDGRWTAFEPTPIRPIPPARAPNDRTLQPTPTPAPSAIRDVPLAQSPLPALLALAALVILLAVGALWALRRPPALALQVQARLERLGARAGVAWPPGATLHEYGALLAARLGAPADTLGPLIDLLAQARYSRRPLTPAQEQQLERAWERISYQLARARGQRPKP